MCARAPATARVSRCALGGRDIRHRGRNKHRSRFLCLSHPPTQKPHPISHTGADHSRAAAAAYPYLFVSLSLRTGHLQEYRARRGLHVSRWKGGSTPYPCVFANFHAIARVSRRGRHERVYTPLIEIQTDINRPAAAPEATAFTPLYVCTRACVCAWPLLSIKKKKRERGRV